MYDTVNIPGTVYFPNIMYDVNMAYADGFDPGQTDSIHNMATDFGLILSERPKFTPPEVKAEYVEVLGGDGSLDLTGAVDGEVHYGDGFLELPFIMHPYLSEKAGLNGYTQIVFCWLGKDVVIELLRHDGRSDPFVIDNVYFRGRVMSVENDHDGKIEKVTMKIRFNVDFMYNYGPNTPAFNPLANMKVRNRWLNGGGSSSYSGGSGGNNDDLIDVPAMGG